MLVYPKGSSLRCLTGLSLWAGILQIISSVFAIASSVAFGALLGLSIFAEGMLDVMPLLPKEVFSVAFINVRTLIAAVICVFVVLSVLNIKQARCHMERNKMLRLYPSQSGLRVYFWSVLLSVFGFVLSACIFVAPLFVGGEITLMTLVFPVVFLFELIVWFYMRKNFDKMMEEV